MTHGSFFIIFQHKICQFCENYGVLSTRGLGDATISIFLTHFIPLLIHEKSVDHKESMRNNSGTCVAMEGPNFNWNTAILADTLGCHNTNIPVCILTVVVQNWPESVESNHISGTVCVSHYSTATLKTR